MEIKLMQFQGGTCSLNARRDARLLLAGLCQRRTAALRVPHQPGICAFLFPAIIGRRVIHSMQVYENMPLWVTLCFIFVDMNFWKRSLCFPFPTLPGGWGLDTASSSGLSFSFELEFSPLVLHLFYLCHLPMRCAGTSALAVWQQERGRDVSNLSHPTGLWRGLHQMWHVVEEGPLVPMGGHEGMDHSSTFGEPPLAGSSMEADRWTWPFTPAGCVVTVCRGRGCGDRFTWWAQCHAGWDSLSPRYQVCLPWPQSPQDRPFLHARNGPSLPDGQVLLSFPFFWVSTENGRVFLCLHKSQAQPGPVCEQWLSGVGQKSGLARTSVQSFNQNELNSNLLLGNEQIGSPGYGCYSVSWIYVFVQSMGARVKIRAVRAL